MRKVFIFMMMSLDGYFEGRNREIDWHNVDAEFNEYAVDMLDHADILLFGRVTYQLMAEYWPSETAVTNDPIVAQRMNSLQKIVFSRTMKKADWHNTRLVKDNIVDEITMLKQQPGRDMVLLGSSNLALTLIRHGLIDEFRIMVNPVVLGNGTALFTGLKERLILKLVKTRTFKSGNVLIYYEPAIK